MTTVIQPQLPPGVVRIGEFEPVRMMFPHLDVPYAAQEGQKKKYGCAIFLPAHYDRTPLQQICQAACEKEWGMDMDRWPDDMRQPFKKAEKCIDRKTGQMYEGLIAGGYLINVSSERPPGLIHLDNSRIANPKVELYAGVWVMVTVNAYTYGGPGTSFRAGVNLGLRSIQLQRKGDPLGGVMVEPEREFAPASAPAGKPGEAPGAKPKSARDLFS